ncbi:hypothetical protein, partial [Paracoccus marcusii]|uniref:hypothetical protein n=1 Tax=Paracoccus marcusii TaxID=59779 RepID=UPI0024926D58
MTAFTQASLPHVHRWTYTAGANEVSIVLPDGCVDLVVLSCDRTGREVFHTIDWDFAPRLVEPRRVCRRLQLLSRMEHHEQDHEQV